MCVLTFIFFFFEIRSCSVGQASLELASNNPPSCFQVVAPDLKTFTLERSYFEILRLGENEFVQGGITFHTGTHLFE